MTKRENKKRMFRLFATGLAAVTLGVAYVQAPAFAVNTVSGYEAESDTVSFTIHFVDAQGDPMTVQNMTDGASGNIVAGTTEELLGQNRQLGSVAMPMPPGVTVADLYTPNDAAYVSAGVLYVDLNTISDGANLYVTLTGEQTASTEPIFVPGTSDADNGTSSAVTAPSSSAAHTSTADSSAESSVAPSASSSVSSSASSAVTSSASSTAVSSVAEASKAPASSDAATTVVKVATQVVAAPIVVAANVVTQAAAVLTADSEVPAPVSVADVQTAAAVNAAAVVTAAAEVSQQVKDAVQNAVADPTVQRALGQLGNKRDAAATAPYQPWDAGSVASVASILTASVSGLGYFILAQKGFFRL